MVKSRRVGYAVVGLGGIAQRAVLPAFRNSKKGSLIAVVSGSRDKAKRLGRRFGASEAYTYEEYGRCLSNPRVEAVFLTSPNGCHAAQTLQAAAAGRHVLCEKPMATTTQDCRSMVEACRASNVRLMIAYRKYFEPASVALKKLVTAGKLGRLQAMHSAFTIFMRVSKVEPWRFDPQLAGGAAMPDVGVYSVNTARWIAGAEPLTASAYSWTLDPSRFNEQLDESMAFQLTFPQGLVLQATASFRAAQASFLQIHGEKGWAALNPAFAYNEERRLFGKINGRWFEKAFPILDEFALEIDAFAESIWRGEDAEPNGVEGLRDVAVIEAIYQSARERRTVPIAAI